MPNKLNSNPIQSNAIWYIDQALLTDFVFLIEPLNTEQLR